MIKRAQAAVETLLIYGVAILIVMLAIGALIGFGVIDLGKLLPDTCGEIGTAFSCENYAVINAEIDDTVQLELKNILGKNIANFTVTVIGEADNEGLWGCTPVDYTPILVNGVISKVVKIPCDIQVPPGKKIQGEILIKFFTVGSSIQRTGTGKFRATVSS